MKIVSQTLQSGKSVRLSEPYVARVPALVGRHAETRKIIAAWISNVRYPLAPLLIGEPGLGKNRIVYEAAKLTGRDLYIFQGHEDVTPSDIECSVRFSDDQDRKMDYILSSVATAALKGGIIFIDEIAKIRPRALAPLASLLDERRYLDSNLLGERIHAAPGFRFVAATNSSDLEGGALPDFLQSRLRPVIQVGYPEPDDLNNILQARFDVLRDDGSHLLRHFWSLWRKYDAKKSPTPRDVISVFGYAQNLSDLDASEIQARESSLNFEAVLSQDHVEQAFETIFGNGKGPK
jgi:MoxR-like ATPase